MATEPDAGALRTRAYHEAAHAVLAAQFGEAITRVSIVPGPHGRSDVAFAGHASLALGDQFAVLLAGEEAQRRLGEADAMAPGDRERAQQALAAAALGEARGRRLLASGQAQAHDLLADAAVWRQVDAVATTLIAEGAIDGDRFRAILASA